MIVFAIGASLFVGFWLLVAYELARYKKRETE